MFCYLVSKYVYLWSWCYSIVMVPRNLNYEIKDQSSSFPHSEPFLPTLRNILSILFIIRMAAVYLS